MGYGPGLVRIGPSNSKQRLCLGEADAGPQLVRRTMGYEVPIHSITFGALGRSLPTPHDNKVVSPFRQQRADRVHTPILHLWAHLDPKVLRLHRSGLRRRRRSGHWDSARSYGGSGPL